jgi:hypothetical protein
MLDKLAGIILQFIVISRKLLLDIGVVIKPACKPILMVQHLANKVGSVIVKHNRDDMKEIRETIVEENEMCGFENPNLVNVESESRYNNPIYWDISPQYLYFAVLMQHCRVYYQGILRLFFLLLVLFSHIV